MSSWRSRKPAGPTTSLTCLPADAARTTRPPNAADCLARALGATRARQSPDRRGQRYDREDLRRRLAEEPGVPVTHLLAEIRERGCTGSANLLVRTGISRGPPRTSTVPLPRASQQPVARNGR
ncbi:hypothetical protein E1292_28585 [Nonomuraea deserti]|uniref:Uncharacterized protein n=1 Tax=Nonomuraea deserti TaxID=1848322 RepID=A0A4R4V5U3_9ACTN|nr:hypothetical protein E1292_28585 [Nonomuraea deserti]